MEPVHGFAGAQEAPVEVLDVPAHTATLRSAFSNVAVVSGNVRTINIGGQDAVDAQGNIVGIGDIAAQTEQVLRNLQTALQAAGAGPSTS
jgi:enamine deaminase RidA (YjgF/YER057c/UK114 family)